MTYNKLLDEILEGTVKDYNEVGAHQYPSQPYYDRDETDKSAQQDFAFAMGDLQKFNTKLKELEKKPKIDLGKYYKDEGVEVKAAEGGSTLNKIVSPYMK